jgi:DNA-binding GntR family transcriptional regulator
MRGNKANWFVNTVPTIGPAEIVQSIESDTLIDQVERDLKKLIATQYQAGDKLPSHLELADILKVSIKTVHDAMCRVSEQGFIQSRRGRYGSFVTRLPEPGKLFTLEAAAAIFVPAKEALFYNYEKVERHLKSLIAKQHQVGERLPSMGQLGETLGVSSNTIRKALQSLAKAGFVRFERGRHGGTFVTRLPETIEEKALTWVSINPQTLQSYGKKTSSTVSS